MVNMRYKTFIIIIASFSIILSSISCYGYQDSRDTEDNNQKDFSNNMAYRIYQHFQNYNTLFWFPGFFITLLLAPFIIFYLIIAIILDIGNP